MTKWITMIFVVLWGLTALYGLILLINWCLDRYPPMTVYQASPRTVLAHAGSDFLVDIEFRRRYYCKSDAYVVWTSPTTQQRLPMQTYQILDEQLNDPHAVFWFMIPRSSHGLYQAMGVFEFQCNPLNFIMPIIIQTPPILIWVQ